MSINLNIEDGNKKSNSDSAKSPSRKAFLSELTVHDIARVFTDFGAQNRVLAIPIGFPQAGKSLLLSSLMYYARKGEDTLFRTNLVNDFPFDKGRLAADQMVDYFNQGKLYQSTEKGSLDLIGIDIQPTKANLPTLNLAFLDLAGEDIKGIKTSEGAVFTDKINAVFNGVKIDNSPIVFILITPFEPPRKDNETSQNGHDREDALHYDFLNYIKQNQPELLNNSKFFIVVSQWDRNSNAQLDVETFIREKRPSIYNYVKNSTVVWGEYSIGKLLESKIDGVQIQEIVRINYEYPSRFWKKMYQICTNKNLDQKSFWEKLFG
jgi:hypothetical protein